MTERTEEIYLNEIQSMPDLSDEEVRSLLEQLARGDSDAGAALTTGCLKRVVRAVQALKITKVPVMDLIQEGNLALLTFLQDPADLSDDPVQALDMAVFRAVKAVLDQETVEKKAGEELSARLNVIDKVCMSIAEEKDREATVEEVADMMRMDPDDVKYLMQIALSALKKY